jgi:enoyl-CoA hydratase/carnithine racemase
MSQTPVPETAASAESQDTVLAERRGAVLILTLNRPKRLNAWNNDLEARYFALLEEADADPQVRAIVVTGAGRGFCSGADLDDLQAVSEGNVAIVNQHSHPHSYPLTMRKPMIAAINGAAVGVGLVEALYCDIRFAAPEAKLTTTFARRGLIAEYGIAWILPRLIGQSRSLDLLMSGRVVMAQDAVAIGLVDYIVEPDELLDTAVAFAEELATYSSPTSMSLIKAQIQRAMDSDFATSVAEANELMLESFSQPDVAEGVASFLEGRQPAFAPLGPR